MSKAKLEYIWLDGYTPTQSLGRLEDRRPNSSADPYKVAARIITTVKLSSEVVMVSVNGNGRGR